MKFRRIINLMSGLMDPEGLSAFLNWKPFSITSFQILKRLKHIGVVYKTIVDGGANIGQFARAAAEIFPDAQIISLEPLPDLADKLKHNLRNCPRVQVINSALGGEDGITLFHRNIYSHVSSALPLHNNFKTTFRDFKNIADLKVPVITLDSVFKNSNVMGPVLLKLDLEGFEMEALKGAQNSLHRIKAVLLEAAFEPMYEGQPLFADLYDYLHKHGFRFKQVLDFQEDPKGNIYQLDALFMKDRSQCD